jgi:hypothetical protein
MQLKTILFKARWLLLALVVILQITVLVLAPNEATLGSGIKPVYLHVSLTWAGMLLFAGSVLLGLILLITGRNGASDWQRVVFQAGLISYGVGFMISLYASWLNWGGIPWQEPKVQAAVNVIVAAIGAWYLRELIKPSRFKGLAGMIPFIFVSLGSNSPRMVLHPDNPVVSSPLGIKSTFLAMFGLAILLAGWYLWVNMPGREKTV